MMTDDDVMRALQRMYDNLEPEQDDEIKPWEIDMAFKKLEEESE